MAKLALIWSKIQMQHDSLPGKLQEVTEQVPGTQSCISNSMGDMITKVGNLVNGLGRVMGDKDWARLMIMVKD